MITSLHVWPSKPIFCDERMRWGRVSPPKATPHMGKHSKTVTKESQ